MYCRLRSIATVTHHFKINESCVKTTVKKKRKKRTTCEAVAIAMLAGIKSLDFMQNIFLSHIENASFMWVQAC